METIIQNVNDSSVQVQALAVTAGGLIGVFATLFMFFLIIWLSARMQKKS